MQPLSKNQMQQIAALKIKKYRDRDGLFQISGINTIEQSLTGPYLRIDKVIIEKGKASLFSSLDWPADTPLFSCSGKDFTRLSEEKSPQGILIIARKTDTSIKNMPLLDKPALYLHEINDPGNLGTVIRTALWYGIDIIFLSPGSTDPFQPKSVRAAAGGISHIRIIEDVSINELSRFKRNGHTIVGANAEGGQSAETVAAKIKRNWMLLMGSEAHGLPDDMLKLCTHTITLARHGVGESLNLAVSAGICLHLLSGCNQE